MEYSLKNVQENDGQRFLLVDNNNNMYTINELLFDILNCYKSTPNIEFVISEINRKYINNPVSKTFIENTLTSVFDKITKNNNSYTKPGEFLKFKLILIKEDKMNHFYGILSNLFNLKAFVSLVIISIITTFFFFNSLTNLSITQIYSYELVDFSIGKIVSIYICFLLIILIHEIGHASASTFFGIKPKEIGFGIYFIFPVLFTNVTNIWQLCKKDRIMVNFGGIYFQLIINIGLIILFNNSVSKSIIFPLILLNIGSMLGSLNPFFKYDGYWIFSDYFDLPNLKVKIDTLTKKLFSAFPNNSFSIIRNESRILTFYLTANLIFWVYVYYRLYQYIQANISNIYLSFGNNSWYANQANLIDTILSCMATITVLYVVIVQFVGTFKLLKR